MCETALFIAWANFTLCSSVICRSDAFEALLTCSVPPETDAAFLLFWLEWKTVRERSCGMKHFIWPMQFVSQDYYLKISLTLHTCVHDIRDQIHQLDVFPFQSFLINFTHTEVLLGTNKEQQNTGWVVFLHGIFQPLPAHTHTIIRLKAPFNNIIIT